MSTFGLISDCFPLLLQQCSNMHYFNIASCLSMLGIHLMQSTICENVTIKSRITIKMCFIRKVKNTTIGNYIWHNYSCVFGEMHL